MGEDSFKNVLQKILSPAGIVLNGERPWDMRIKDGKFYRRVLSEGSLGLGESYMDGWWECDDLIEFFRRVIPTNAEKKLKKSPALLLYLFQSIVLNPGRRARAFRIGERHYDIGNELFTHMLDKRMVYSCAYWKTADNLDNAQEAKLDLICRKLCLRQGDRVLDIGCGWGSFAKYAAEKYGVSVVGVTVSKEQTALGQELCKGLPVEIRLQDYRELNEKFDRIASVGMFEHVGYKNYRIYMEIINRCLKDPGLFLLQTIGQSISQRSGDLWINKYIFPDSIIPSMKQISASIEGLSVIEDMHDFGAYYDRTLCCWHDNFEKSWEKLKHIYDERFHRMWSYYLRSLAGAFRSGYLHVWQIVFSKGTVTAAYPTVR